MSEPRKDAEQYAHWFETAIAQARTGDREIAVSLVGEFAQLATDPHVFDSVGGIPTALLQYIAACLGDWKKHDFRDAEKSFSVTRAAFRPDETSDQHVDAMRAYLLLMARGRGVVAARVSAAAYSGLTEEQVRHMLVYCSVLDRT